MKTRIPGFIDTMYRCKILTLAILPFKASGFINESEGATRVKVSHQTNKI